MLNRALEAIRGFLANPLPPTRDDGGSGRVGEDAGPPRAEGTGREDSGADAGPRKRGDEDAAPPPSGGSSRTYEAEGAGVPRDGHRLPDRPGSETTGVPSHQDSQRVEEEDGESQPRYARLAAAYLNARAEEMLALLLEEMTRDVAREMNRAVEGSRQAMSAEMGEIKEGVLSSQRDLSRMGRELVRAGATLDSLREAVVAVAPSMERLQAALAAELAQERERAERLREEAEREGVEDMLAALDGLEAGLEYGRELVGSLGDAQRRLKDATVQRWWRAMGEAIGAKRPLPEIPVSDVEGWIDGLELTRRRLQDALARRGITPIEALGRPFDPHLHEAVAVEPCPEEQDGLVLREERRGYRTPERIIRLAQVVVGKGVPPKPAARRRQSSRATAERTSEEREDARRKETDENKRENEEVEAEP